MDFQFLVDSAVSQSNRQRSLEQRVEQLEETVGFLCDEVLKLWEELNHE